MIYTIATEILMVLVRAYRVFLGNNFMHFPAEISSLDMSYVCECSIFAVPVLKIRSPGVAI